MREITSATPKAQHRASNGVRREPLRNAKEVAAEFGYSSVSALHNALAGGKFPEPDEKLCSGALRGGTKLYWKVSTLAKEHSRRLALQK